MGNGESQAHKTKKVNESLHANHTLATTGEGQKLDQYHYVNVLLLCENIRIFS